MPETDDAETVLHSRDFLVDIRRQYAEVVRQPGYLLSVGMSAVAFALSIVMSSFAITFSSERASNAVSDLILSNTPILDVDGAYVYGVVLLVAFIAAIIFIRPKRIPFVLYSLALFFGTRSVFVTLTHLGPFALHTGSDFGATIQRIFFGNDYFFSGHTGSPFLMALVFWRERILRYIFLAWSIFFGAVVLLGHLHYSIDVFAAFYITFAIYHMAMLLFPRAKQLFDESKMPTPDVIH